MIRTRLALKPTGQNGLSLSLAIPDLKYSPHLMATGEGSPAYEWLRRGAQAGLDLREDVARGSLVVACSRITNDVFSVLHEGTYARIEHVERQWQEGHGALNIDTAFWEACYKRMHIPQDCRKREEYLQLEVAVLFSGQQLLMRKPEKEIYDEACADILVALQLRPVDDRKGAEHNLHGLVFAVEQHVLAQQAASEESSSQAATAAVSKVSSSENGENVRRSV
jgi:hypothetical protein